MITQAELKEILHYEPNTGEFTWLVDQYRVKAGTVAGGIHSNGYRQIGIKHKRYLAHRLAWLYVHGIWPVEDLDHVNGIRHDNRIANLRECSRAENMQNIPQLLSTNTSGYMGVHPSGKKWKAKISHQGKQYNLGRYDTPAQAHQAYLDAKAQLHTFNPVPRQ